MVPADSHRVSRAPRYLGATGKEKSIFRYRAVTFFGRPFHAVLLTVFSSFVRIRTTSSFSAQLDSYSLWSCNPALSSRIARFRLSRFRSPLLSESRLFSLPRGTKMVHFPPFAPIDYEFIDW